MTLQLASTNENKIKRPPSAYLLFSIAIRKQTKEENPDINSKALMKLIGEKWKSLSEDEKKPYTEQADIEKKRYNDEVVIYKATMPQKPKSAVSAYIHFSNDVRDRIRSENPGASLGEISKKIGAAWRAILPDEKESYIMKAKEDSQRFKDEMSKFPEGTFVKKNKKKATKENEKSNVV